MVARYGKRVSERCDQCALEIESDGRAKGFRAVRRSAAVKVPLHAVDFDVEQHMIVQFLKCGYRVTEVRSHEYCRKWGESKLPTYRKAYLFFWRLFLDLVSGARAR